MDPNAKFYQYQGPSYAPQPQRSGRGKKIVLTLLFLLVTAGLVGGMYWWQQQRVDVITREKDALQQQLATTTQSEDETVTPNQFNYPKAPFTFSYPGDWTLTSPQPVTFDAALPEDYEIELLAPGTVRTVTESGAPDVVTKNGARITMHKIAETETDVKKALNGDFPPASDDQTFTDVKIAGQAGVTYIQQGNGPASLVSAFIKDGALFMFRFDADDDANLKNNDHYKTYQTLINSFQFK